MIDFYIFRHGQTDWNKLKKIQGHTDIPLNETGKKEALILRDFFKEIKVDAVYSSDLARAHETAQISFHEKSVSIIKTRDLREAFCGEVEGMSKKDIVKTYKQSFWDKQLKSKDALDFSYPGGETRREVKSRLVSFIKDIVKKGEHSSVGISTHGGALRILLHSFLPEEAELIPIPNCVVYKLSFREGEYEVVGPLK
ncbi:hypothetical protein A9Q84_04740 [Halobacteriovorax marinus]|uniref:Phosphoglycerate mutase n=1 Tax=Halobacteriovorax marinus TaxID=97084 RepID=A0A1Y5FEV1_9BACT|nr:hypothetical protein A9Q84_04740 [Halobacteriovorax marinus]